MRCFLPTGQMHHMQQRVAFLSSIPLNVTEIVVGWFVCVVQLDAALEAVRVMCVPAAVAYLIQVSILELFASPTAGLLKALAKELYISQVTQVGSGKEVILRTPMLASRETFGKLSLGVVGCEIGHCMHERL